MDFALLTKSACSQRFVLVLTVLFLMSFCAWKANASGLSLTLCDDVCGIAKEPSFKDRDTGAQSEKCLVLPYSLLSHPSTLFYLSLSLALSIYKA